MRSTDQFSDIDRHPHNEPTPGVAVLRVESGVFFANADAVRDAIKRAAAEPGIHGVVLDAEAIAFVDVTSVRMLHEVGDDLVRTGQRLVVARDLGQVADLLDADPDSAITLTRSIRAGIAEIIGSSQ